MPRLVLWGSTATTATVAHMVLMEAGADFEARFISLREGENRQPAFLALNPKGEVPVLVTPCGSAITETPVVCQFIAETHPHADLLPADQTARAQCLGWLAWCSYRQANTYALALMPGRGARDQAAQQGVREAALRRVGKALAHLDAALDDGRDFLMGGQPTLPDFYVALQTRWAGRLGAALPARVESHRARVLARPAVARVLAIEGMDPTPLPDRASPTMLRSCPTHSSIPFPSSISATARPTGTPPA
jgi:glutathione S-transferase